MLVYVYNKVLKVKHWFLDTWATSSLFQATGFYCSSEIHSGVCMQGYTNMHITIGNYNTLISGFLDQVYSKFTFGSNSRGYMLNFSG